MYDDETLMKMDMYPVIPVVIDHTGKVEYRLVMQSGVEKMQSFSTWNYSDLSVMDVTVIAKGSSIYLQRS